MTPFTIVSRRSYDDFNLELFSQCLKKFKFNHNAYYLFPQWDFEEKLKTIQGTFTEKYIVLCIKDNLEVGPHGYWCDRTPLPGSIILQNFIEQNSDHEFIVLTTMENLDQEIQTHNVKIISMMADGLDQRDLYRTLASAKEKDMDSHYVYLNLNRHNRLHRITALSYLFGKGLDRYGLISCIMRGSKEDFRHPMMHSTASDETKLLLARGQDRLWGTKFDETYQIFDGPGEQNYQNFQKNLKPKYQKVFVELVSESLFSSLTYYLSEKTFHCMYGYCFPIILSGYGIIEHMRKLGFDMFDDIVDHGYDQITGSVERIITAIDNNERLLSDLDYVKNLWRANFDRFEHNAKIARIGAERFYVERFWNQIDDLVKSVSG